MNKNRVVIFLLAVAVILGIWASFSLFNLIVAIISSLIIILIYILIISQLKQKKVYSSRYDMKSIKREIEEKSQEAEEEEQEEEDEEVDKEETEKFVASEGSGKFHSKDCRYAKNIKGKKLTGSKEFFKNKGYKPCGVCNP
jgi:uncharacterized membrane protein (DUF106 family)